MLETKVLGSKRSDIIEIRQPQKRLQALAATNPTDSLAAATQDVLKIAKKHAELQTEDFGVFGSMLHGFHHPEYSDIDLVVYGRQPNAKMREILCELYSDGLSGFRNEFENPSAMTGKKWRFKNFSVKEFMWHQKRKYIYGLYDDRKTGRTIKAEFEPVKDWDEIQSEYNPETKIVRKGWARIKARVTADEDAPFIPSVYGIKTVEILSGSKDAAEAIRVISYMEEFRQQVQKDETIIVEGNLEEVKSPEGAYHQMALSYCPRYYEQMLKVANLAF